MSGEPATADEVLVTGGSHRGVAQDFLVLPAGGELTGQMKFLTSEAILGDTPLRFTDLALFGLAGRWSLLPKLEVHGEVDLLPKQPSDRSEKPWQSVAFGIRSPIGRRVAVDLGGAGGHLVGHAGMWLQQSLSIEVRKPIQRDLVQFDIKGGVDALALRAPNRDGALLTEVSVATSALFREPTGHWGAWLGLGYAVPLHASGTDPTTAMAIDPQPRLDFHLGTVLAVAPAWDLFADFAVIDRGDAADPATRLPILDGGFDQRQIVFGVTRHLQPRHHHHYDPPDAPLQLGSL
jgi:hypothetical protein